MEIVGNSATKTKGGGVKKFRNLREINRRFLEDADCNAAFNAVYFNFLTTAFGVAKYDPKGVEKLSEQILNAIFELVGTYEINWDVCPNASVQAAGRAVVGYELLARRAKGRITVKGNIMPSKISRICNNIYKFNSFKNNAPPLVVWKNGGFPVEDWESDPVPRPIPRNLNPVTEANVLDVKRMNRLC